MTNIEREQKKAELMELENAVQTILDYMAKYGSEVGDSQDRYAYGTDLLKYGKNADVKEILASPSKVKKFFDIAYNAINKIYYRKVK